VIGQCNGKFHPGYNEPAIDCQLSTAFERASSLLSQKFVQKVQLVAMAESEIKSPFVPLLSKGESFLCLQTPLWKREEGEISWSLSGIM
jgi:hypothetical protein